MLQKFKSLSKIKKFGLIAGTLLVLSMFGSGNQQKQASLNVQNADSKSVLNLDDKNTTEKDKLPVVTTKTVSETEAIPYSSTTVNSSSLAKSQTKVTTQGVNGVKTFTYTVTTTDGVETNKELISEQVTTQPVTQVTTVGTYVAKTSSSNCDPNYSGCVPNASDVDCAGGSGNGPAYVSGPIRVIGSDIYGLDRDNDGIACE